MPPWGTPIGIDPLFGQQAGVSTAESKLHLGPQEPVRSMRVRRKHTTVERQEVDLKRRTGACQDCRKAKLRVSVVADSGLSTTTNTCLVSTCPARGSPARRSYTVPYLIDGTN